MAFFSEIAQSIDSVSSGLNSLFSGANNPVTNNKKYSNFRIFFQNVLLNLIKLPDR